MLKKGIIIFVSVICLWFLIDSLINYDSGNLEAVEITYSSEVKPINLSIYFSSSELFSAENFITRSPKKTEKDDYNVAFTLNNEYVGNIRLDTEFKDLNSEIIIQKLILKFENDTISIHGNQLNQFIESANFLKYEQVKEGLKIEPLNNEIESDFFLVLSSLSNISNSFHGGVLKSVFLQIIFTILLIIVLHNKIFSNDGFFWCLFTSLFFISIFLEFYFLSWLTAILMIVGTYNIYKNGFRNNRKKRGLLISVIYLLYLVYIILTQDLGVVKLLEYQFSIVVFPVIFYWINLSEHNIEKSKMIYEYICYIIICLYSISISLFLLESSLSILELFKSSQYLLHSIFDWLDKTLHPSFLSYALFIGLLFMIKRNENKVQLNVATIIWLCLYLIVMLLIGSRISVLLFIVLISYFVFENLRWKKKGLKHSYVILITFIFILIFHFLLFNYFLLNLDDSRFHLWKLSIDLIKDNPWRGIDYGEFRHMYEQYLLNNGLTNLKVFGHPHNQFLFFGLNFGVPILTVFIIILVLMLYYALKEGNYLLFFFLFGSIIFMTFELLLNSIKGIVPFAFFYSLISYSFIQRDNAIGL